MAYDDDLADRLRGLLQAQPGVEERRMFGGLAFLVGGHMAVAASGEGGLMVRCHADDTDRLSAEPGAAPMVMRGRPMTGWLRVDGAALGDDAVLQGWVEVGVRHVATLPPKGG
jgi:TfoX/Sxy family transcriptional regulator of competence genes